MIRPVPQFGWHCSPGVSKPVPADSDSSWSNSGSILALSFFSIQTRALNDSSELCGRGLWGCCAVSIDATSCLPNTSSLPHICYQLRTSLFYSRSGRSSLPARALLRLMCSASFSALALVHAFAGSLLRPVSSLLLSFQRWRFALGVLGVFLAPRLHHILKLYRSHFLAAALLIARGRSPKR